MMAKKLLGLGIILIFASFAYAQQEQLTITTYYPSPHGSYRELTAQRMKIGTTYSGAATTVNDNDLIVEGNVGIGTTSPQSTLQVNGGVQVGGDDNANNNCLATKAGTLRYNSGKLEYCDGTNWKSAFAGNVYESPWTSVTPNKTYTFQHNLGVIPKSLLIYYSSSNDGSTPVSPIVTGDCGGTWSGVKNVSIGTVNITLTTIAYLTCYYRTGTIYPISGYYKVIARD